MLGVFIAVSQPRMHLQNQTRWYLTVGIQIQQLSRQFSAKTVSRFVYVYNHVAELLPWRSGDCLKDLKPVCHQFLDPACGITIT